MVVVVKGLLMLLAAAVAVIQVVVVEEMLIRAVAMAEAEAPITLVLVNQIQPELMRVMDRLFFHGEQVL
jgi:hypothetical protein